MLIPIFETHFLQARLNQTWPHYGLNSFIILYYIFIPLSITQTHATYGGKLRKCGLEIREAYLGLFMNLNLGFTSELGTLVKAKGP